MPKSQNRTWKIRPHREPAICIRQRALLSSTMALIVLFALPPLLAVADPDIAPSTATADTLVQNTLANWDRRFKATKSFEYHCEVQHAKAVLTNPQNNDAEPFGAIHHTPDNSQTIALRSRFSYVMSGDKLAFREIGERWDPTLGKRVEKQVDVVFDGTTDLSLTDFHIGVVQGHLFHNVIPGPLLTDYIYLTPLRMAYNPLDCLTREGLDTAHILVASANSVVDGVDCVQLSLVRQDPQWHMSLWVDPARDFVPVKIRSECNGKPCYETAIQYAADSGVGWRVAGWTLKLYDKTEMCTETTNGYVTKASLNQPPDDKIFTLTFPVGAQVIERKGATTTYFVVRENGKREPIPEAEYGTVPNQGQKKSSGTDSRDGDKSD